MRPDTARPDTAGPDTPGPDTGGPVRPENVVLDPEQRERVSRHVRLAGVTCPGCGSGSFTVGNALPLGFLFVDEEHGRYMVGLTCTRAGCPSPRTGVKLDGSEFLVPGEERRPGRAFTAFSWCVAVALGSLAELARRRRSGGRSAR